MELIPAQYYEPLYLLIVTVLSFLFFSGYRYTSNDSLGLRDQGVHGGFIICLFMILFIGTRPISEVFVDMTQYVGILYREGGLPFKFDWQEDNIIYNNLMYYFASINFPPILFYILIAGIYYGCVYWACRIMFPNTSSLAFVVFLAAFSSFSYGTNGIKAGAAASVFILAIAYKKKLLFSLILVLLSIGIHHSMVLPAVAYICVLLYHKPIVYLLFWLFCLFIAAAHITSFQNLFAGLADEKGARYLTATDGFLTGFRLDFILYSAMPIVVGWYSIYKKRIQSDFYQILLCLYVLINGVWMLCMYAEYTNRIAYLSWALYPFVLIYPVLNKLSWAGNKYRAFRIIAYLHLGFTLFMETVYYGILK